MIPSGITMTMMAQLLTKLEPLGLPKITSLLCRRYLASKSRSKGVMPVASSTSIKPKKPIYKSKKTLRIMKLHHENKMLFGDLLETKIEKAKREKMERKEDLNLKQQGIIKISKVPKLLTIKSTQDTCVNHTSETESLASSEDKNTKDSKNDGGVIKSKSKASTVLNKKLVPDLKLTSAPESTLPNSAVQFQVPTSIINNLTNISEVINPPSTPVSYPFAHATSGIRFPSVTRILSATMSPEQKAILQKWEQKMIKEMGQERFQQYKEELFSSGRDLHCNIRQLLSGTQESELLIRDAIEGHWRSLRHILYEIEETHFLESHVSHPHLEYCGIVDCVAQFRDKLVLIDWKTSEKAKPLLTMTYDTPLQIAAYVGAMNEDPKYSMKVKEGLIVIAYKDGRECETFFLTESALAVYWRQWTQRLALYRDQGKEEAQSLEINKTD